jgi:ribonuclease D
LIVFAFSVIVVASSRVRFSSIVHASGGSANYRSTGTAFLTRGNPCRNRAMNLITDNADIRRFCESLRSADFVTVDTEFIRDKTFWPQLCLVQLAGPDEAAAIDPLAADVDLAPLLDLLDDPDVLKVMHAARQDIEIFFHMNGKVPAPLFDTQVAAMVCGFGDQVGYETLIARLTGTRLDKSSRFTDWAMRPLRDRQLEYALGDVTHLREAYEKLRGRVEADDRLGWIDEEMATICDPASYRVEPVTAWQRLKPRTGNRRFLAVLQAVASWREEQAMTRDLPRNRVIRDESLSEIAAHPPADADELSRIRGVSRGFAEGSMGASLLKAVAAGLAVPENDAPELPPREDIPPGVGPLTDLLKVLLKHKCEQHHVAQKLVASSSDLDRIAADDDADVPALHGWRRTLFGDDALRLKHGELALAATGTRVRLVPVNASGEAEVPPLPPAPQGSGRSRRRRRRRGGGNGDASAVAREADTG